MIDHDARPGGYDNPQEEYGDWQTPASREDAVIEDLRGEIAALKTKAMVDDEAIKRLADDVRQKREMIDALNGTVERLTADLVDAEVRFATLEETIRLGQDNRDDMDEHYYQMGR
jgi:chromosome segregation ATPase